MTPETIAEGLVLSRPAAGVLEIRIDRPQARNALSIAVSNGLSALWRRINQDDTVNVAILTSSDCGAFCAGMDLKEAASIRAREGKDVISYLDDPFQSAMREVRVPLIAAMTGSFTAGGMMLALNCDLRVGLRDTYGGIAEAKVGRGSPWGVPLLWMLPQALLMEMTLTGEFVPIARLKDLGFINDVADSPDGVRARALELAQVISSNAPLSVRAGKASILAAASLGADRGLDKAIDIYAQTYASEDAQEGMRAFAEKRPAQWQGR